jgi:hypothetical protein
MPGSFFHDSRAVLYDADGNPVTVILDAEGNYRLAVDAVLGDNLTEAKCRVITG